MGGNSAPSSPNSRGGRSVLTRQKSSPSSANATQSAAAAPSLKKVIDSCRTNFARELQKTFELDDLDPTDDEIAKAKMAAAVAGGDNSATVSTRSSSAASKRSSLSPRSQKLGRSGGGGLGDESSSQRLARRILESCERVSGEGFKTAAAAADGSPHFDAGGRASRSRSSLLMISSGTTALLTPPNQSQEVTSTSHQGSHSTASSPRSRSSAAAGKSNSAPPSPVKQPSGMSPRGVAASAADANARTPGASVTGRKRQLTAGNGDAGQVAGKKPKWSNTKSSLKKPTTASSSVAESASSKQSSSSASAVGRRKAAPMDEVMKLHQDEGVLHILHSLPTSRRKEKVNYFPTRQQQQQSPGGGGGANRASLLGSLHHKRLSPGGHGGPLLSLAAQMAAQASASSNAGFASSGAGRASKKRGAEQRNNLLRVKGPVAPVSKDDILAPKVLDLLKKLPKEEYLNLWSSTTRYKLAEEALTLAVHSGGSGRGEHSDQSSISPDSSVGSDISSASKLAATLSASSSRARGGRKALIGGRMLTNVTLVSRQFKDILLRSYPTFTQLLLCPSTSTGLRQSLGVAVMTELVEALDLLRDRDDPSADAVMVTGMGNIFSQGIDLTALTHDGQQEKQRRSAAALAGAVRKLCLTLASYPKLVVAVVNGAAVGLGVTLLPYFDLVYASDRAAFRADYVRLGQIPEGFPSVTMECGGGGASAAGTGVREMLLAGREMTAQEAERCGIVTRVVWPDKLMEEVVPRMEEMSELSRRGVQATKAYLRDRLKRRVSEVAEEETRLLVKSWTGHDFAANLKKYLKTTDRVIFQ